MRPERQQNWRSKAGSRLWLSGLIAAMGATRTEAVSRARRRMKSTIAASSITGCVLGMTIMVVTPPAAAASDALASVSRYSVPGSPVNINQNENIIDSETLLQGQTTIKGAHILIERRTTNFPSLASSLQFEKARWSLSG